MQVLDDSEICNEVCNNNNININNNNNNNNSWLRKLSSEPEVDWMLAVAFKLFRHLIKYTNKKLLPTSIDLNLILFVVNDLNTDSCYYISASYWLVLLKMFRSNGEHILEEALNFNHNKCSDRDRIKDIATKATIVKHVKFILQNNYIGNDPSYIIVRQTKDCRWW